MSSSVARSYGGGDIRRLFAETPALVTGSRDNTAKLWELRGGKELMTLKGHSQEVTAVDFSSDGENILTGGPTARSWFGLRFPGKRPRRWSLGRGSRCNNKSLGRHGSGIVHGYLENIS